MNQPSQHKTRIIHTQTKAFQKCFGCIHLRIGGSLSCIVWASLSFYFVVISFQSQSPFFSYLPSTAPFIIFGIANLLLGAISLYILVALYMNQFRYLIVISPAIFLGVGVVIIDAVINVILFITKRNEYINWCISTASDLFQSSGQINTSSTDLVDRDFYNCDRSWQDELKFGVLGTTMIVGFYVYWALCIRSYWLKKQISLNHMMDQMHGPQVPPMGGHPPPIMAPPMRRGGGPAVIVLHNQKPFKNESRELSV